MTHASTAPGRHAKLFALLAQTDQAEAHAARHRAERPLDAKTGEMILRRCAASLRPHPEETPRPPPVRKWFWLPVRT